MNKQTRVIELLTMLREAITPEIDGMLCELEELTSCDPDDADAWNPDDAQGQAIKEGARESFCFVNSAMHQVMGARAVITETLFIPVRFSTDL
jgi:hypothetical protein